MQKKIFTVFLFLPMLAIAQQNVELKFEEGSTWQEILSRAKAENKYVFVDMMATWCAPCKAMDKFTYPQQKLGDALNSQFISLKVQIDSTAADNQFVKSWYKDAAFLAKKYGVDALPTFLFFSPEGRIVHRGTGMKNPDQLIALAKEAINPEKQLYTLLDKYRSGTVQDLIKFPQLAQTAKAAGDEKLAETIAQEYLEKRIYKMTPSSLRATDIVFIRENIHSSADKGFKMLIDPVIAKTINDTMIKAGFVSNYSSLVADNIIMKEEVSSLLKSGEKNFEKDPDWKKIQASIEKKYGDATAGRVILNAQIKMYWEKKDWENVTRVWFKKLNTYGLDDKSYYGRSLLNNFIYETVFQKVDDKALLKEAVRWMEEIVRADSLDPALVSLLTIRTNNMDTYAKLLYKYGKKEQGINWQEKAVQLDEEDARKNNKKPDDKLRKALDEMKANAFTWTNQN
jgi:thioredoxin-related protein